MSQNKIFYISLILTTALIAGCGSVTPVASTYVPTATLTAPIPTKQLVHNNYGIIQTSLEILRDGEKYNIPLGYDYRGVYINNSFIDPPMEDYIASPPMNGATIKWIGDIDHDDEMEYVVELLYCSNECSKRVVVIDYDLKINDYRVFDSLDGLDWVDYQDFEKDGNPEIVTKDYGYLHFIGDCGVCATVSPIKIYRYNGKQAKFIVVTSQFPDLVQKDANVYLLSIKNNFQESENASMLASYLYDMFILAKQAEGIDTFREVCTQYVQPKVTNPDWSCDNYLSKVVSVLQEMKIGSE